MNFRSAATALAATLVVGLASAQTPLPTPATPAPAAAAAPAVVATPPAPAPSVSKAWVLMDYATGQVLAGENINEQLAPASITKVMTSDVVAAEVKNGKVRADDPVMMSERAWREGGAGTDGSYSGFPVNQTARLEDMEKGMAIQSGNDAAIALAEHVAGSEEAFASLMNSYAAKLGMKDSHFVNAHGLSAQGHHSTAYDLALLGRAMVRDYPETYAYNKVKEFQVGNIKQPNRNLLLWRDKTVDGLKTGHTDEAGYCMVASAVRDGQRLIAVVFGTNSEQSRAAETQKLLTYGFRFFETQTFYQKGTELTQAPVWKGATGQIKAGLADDLTMTMPKGQLKRLQASMTMNPQLTAPIAKGDVIGKVEVKLDEKVVHSADLIALDGVEEGGFFRRMWDSIRLFFYGLFN